MSDNYQVVNEPEDMFIIPEDMPYDSLLTFEVLSRLLERIEGLAEVLYAANSGIDNGAYQPCERAMKHTTEIIRVLAKQASQVAEHIRTKGGKS